MRILTLALVLVIAACGRRIASDDEPDATRVVSLMPAATAVVRALDAAQLLVGRTLEDSASDIAQLPAVGRVLDPSVESIVALDPDLVLAWDDARGVVSRLIEAGIGVYATRFERVADVAVNTREIGYLLGRSERGDSIAEHITQQLKTLRAATPQRRHPSVLYLLQIDPLWTAGPRTFVDDLINVAGGRNIFGDLRVQWSLIALEVVATRQPDVIIVAQADNRKGSRAWLTQPPWRSLRATQAGRVYFVDADRFNRPGPDIVETAHELVRLLHGEAVIDG